MKLLLIGASAGSISILIQILQSLDLEKCCVLLAIHLPSTMIEDYATLLGKRVWEEVRIAQEGERLEPGKIYICDNESSFIDLCHGEWGLHLSYNSQKGLFHPDINHLFTSVAKSGYDTRKVVALLLSGIGSDGATGLRVLREAGAHTLVLSKRSCAIFGMPRAAIEQRAYERIVELHEIGDIVQRYLDE